MVSPPIKNPGYAYAFCDIFALQKVPFLKISDDVIACDLWFGPPPNQKSWLRLWIKTAFFFQKITKIAQRLGASPPDPRLWYV